MIPFWLLKNRPKYIFSKYTEKKGAEIASLGELFASYFDICLFSHCHSLVIIQY